MISIGQRMFTTCAQTTIDLSWRGRKAASDGGSGAIESLCYVVTGHLRAKLFGYDVSAFARCKGHTLGARRDRLPAKTCLTVVYYKTFFCRSREGREAKTTKIRNGKNCCLRLEQFKNETWTLARTRTGMEGGSYGKGPLIPLGQSRKTRFAPAASPLDSLDLLLREFIYKVSRAPPSPLPYFFTFPFILAIPPPHLHLKRVPRFAEQKQRIFFFRSSISL